MARVMLKELIGKRAMVINRIRDRVCSGCWPG